MEDEETERYDASHRQPFAHIQVIKSKGLRKMVTEDWLRIEGGIFGMKKLFEDAHKYIIKKWKLAGFEETLDFLFLFYKTNFIIKFYF